MAGQLQHLFMENRLQALQNQIIEQLGRNPLAIANERQGPVSVVGRRVGNYAREAARAVVNRGNYQTTPVADRAAPPAEDISPARGERTRVRTRTETRLRRRRIPVRRLFGFYREPYRRRYRGSYDPKRWRNANIRFNLTR